MDSYFFEIQHLFLAICFLLPVDLIQDPQVSEALIELESFLNSSAGIRA